MPASDIIDGNLGDGVDEILGLNRGELTSAIKHSSPFNGTCDSGAGRHRGHEV